MIQIDELNIELTDEEWPLEWIDHDRVIARAIVVDDEGYYYFVRAERDDDFGKATLIETSGGGVEPGEELTEAIRRELREELGRARVVLAVERDLRADFDDVAIGARERRHHAWPHGPQHAPPLERLALGPFVGARGRMPLRRHHAHTPR